MNQTEGTIRDYIGWRGDLSFEEKELNDADNLVLCFFSYVNLRNVWKSGHSMTIREAVSRLSDEGGIRLEVIKGSEHPEEIIEAAASSLRFSTTGLMQQVFKMRGNKVDGSVCLELDPDMKTVKGEEHPIVPGHVKAKGTEFEGHAFYEASSIRKVNGRYCYVYSSELSHELCYAYSYSPTGGFRYGGTLISIADIGYKGNQTPLNYTGNTHGGMAEMNGHWYIFYHRQTNRRKCCRQGCAEKLNIRTDGTIEQAQVTSCGLNEGPLQAKGVYEARIACLLNGKDGIISSDGAEKKDKKMLYPYFTQTGEDREDNGDQYIANMKDGAWCGFRYFSFAGDEKEITLCAKSTSYGVVTVHSERDHKPLAEIAVSPSADWSAFAGLLNTEEGTSALYFIFHGTGTMDFRSFGIK